MEKQKFEELKELEYRIINLKLIKEVLASNLNNKELMIQASISVMGHKTTNPVKSIFLSGRNDSNTHKSDADFICDAIQQRIDELEKQFENL